MKNNSIRVVTIIQYSIILVISVLLGNFLPRGEQNFDTCNQNGFPLISLRGGLCSSDLYDWTGVNILMAIVNTIFWMIVFSLALFVVKKIFLKPVK